MAKPTLSPDLPLGERLLKIRAWRKMTLKTLHEQAHVGIGTISDIENGIRQPNTTTLIKLAKALRVSLNTLTGA